MKLTLEKYRELSKRFNKMSFTDKIIKLKENPDYIKLGSDHNFWRVKVTDPEIQEQLEDLEENFHIENEWGYGEMHSLLYIIGLDIVDA